MRITQLNIDSITPYENNPRINEQAVEAVARSLQEFGFQQPIVVDAKRVIIVGHTRWLAAKSLNWKRVPVVIADHLTAAQVKAYRIADNQTSNLADWDYDLLGMELHDLQLAEFDLNLLGFDECDLSQMLNPDSQEGQTDPDEIPTLPRKPKSRSGTIYQLGTHRLLVGDATEAEGISRLMKLAKASLLLTDPPYNVAYVGKTVEVLTIENDRMDDAAFRSFLVEAFRTADSVLNPGAGFYIWHADSEGFNVRGACRDIGWPVRQCLIWAKDTLVMGRQDYHWQHEPCLYGWKPGAKHQWQTDRKQTTLLEFPRPTRSAEHPTMKPVELFEYQIRNSTRVKQIVLDPFAGSGTTVIACERSNRSARTVELDPRYADVIRRRWAEYVHGAGCDWIRLTPALGDVDG